MTVASRAISFIPALAICCLLAACGGGGGGTVADVPEIGTLSTTMALAGQTVVVNGSGFGAAQGTSGLTLNGLAFTIATWTNTRIEAVVPTGATSGTVTVTVGGRSSTGGAGAQLEVRSVLPVLDAVTPDGADRDGTVVLTGANFGDTACLVVFANTDGTEHEAIVTSWSDTSAEVIVPGLSAGEASVALGINTWRSDPLDFFCTGGSGTSSPLITSVDPLSGTVGTTVTIWGQLFGDGQSTSTLLLGDVPMDVVSWAGNKIEARVPEGAVSGLIRLTVSQYPELVWPSWPNALFVVAEQPEITGINPGQMIIGQPLTIYGTNFGDSRGTVRIGGKLQTLGEWKPYGTEGTYQITLPALRPFTDNPATQEDGGGNLITNELGLPVEYFEVVVTSHDDLATPAVLAPRGTGLAATASVNHLVGERSELGADNGTVFAFAAEVSGGSGLYSLELTPDITQPSVTSDNYDAGSQTLEYTYPYSASVPDRMNYETLVKVTDDSTGDYTAVPGPELHVVNHGVPVIESLGVDSFNKGYPGPNNMCLSLMTGLYGGFSFGAGMYFTSHLGTVTEGAETLEKHTRDLVSYMIDGDRTRPLGHRYFNDDGSETTDGAIIAVRGLNFGDDPGVIQLNATGGTPVTVTALAPTVNLPTGWSDTEVRFYLPPVLAHLTGTVQIIPAGDDHFANSPAPLTCSPYILDVAPDSDLYVDTDVVTLTGFDLCPPQIAGSIGDGTYSIWYVPVSYVDPWTTVSTTSHGLLVNPVPADAIAGTTVQFALADLDPDQDGVVQAEVLNASGSESAIVDGELANGSYMFFLWTGVLEDGTPEEIANSGIFSERYILSYCWAGPPPNDIPTAVLTAAPTNGAVPLAVTYDGGSSTDDGTIVNYEWDFDGDLTYSEAGAESAAAGSPGPHTYTYVAEGNYTVRLRVTDDEGLMDTDAKLIVVDNSPTVFSITLNVYLADFESYSGTSQTLARLYDGDPTTGGAAIAQYALDHVAAGVGNPATCVFDDLPGSDYYYIRLQTPVVHWDGDVEPEVIRDFGPYIVPPDTVVDIYGTQWREPPLPS